MSQSGRVVMNFLVVGLESSCTRYVSILLATNLKIISPEGWNGHDKVEGKGMSVVHRSLPHGSRDNFIAKDYWMSFDKIILCTRDMNCSLESKIFWHQRDRNLAIEEQKKGSAVMSEILRVHPMTEIYSYESSFLLGRDYNKMFFEKIGVPYIKHIETKEINSKYFSNS